MLMREATRDGGSNNECHDSCHGFGVREQTKEVFEDTAVGGQKVLTGGSEELREVRLQAGFSLCVCSGRVYFSLVWEFRVACLCWKAWSVVTSCWCVCLIL